MSLVSLLRACRTGGYRLASPLDQALRMALRRAALPPLWLRRHVGPPSAFETAATETAAWLDRLGLVGPSATVLDVGCGCGAMVPELTRRLDENGRYVGFDVHRPSVAWCQRHYAADRRLRFVLAEIATPYSTDPSCAPVSSYRFPADDGEVSLVLAKSVFTHLLEEETRHYLSEIARVLAPHGRAFVSFFLFEADSNPPPAFPFPRTGRAPVRWRVNDHPRAAVAYEKQAAVSFVEAAGLKTETFIPGFWPGSQSRPLGQDQLVLARE